VRLNDLLESGPRRQPLAEAQGRDIGIVPRRSVASWATARRARVPPVRTWTSTKAILIPVHTVKIKATSSSRA